jgi:NAD(P)H-dependent FMN reductase
MKRIERKKILAFGASNSRNSINKRLAGYTASLLNDIEMHLLDLNDFEMPIYSIDIEKETGIPETVYRFKSYIDDADGIIISFAEHNGHYTAVFKNIFDWLTRINRNIWQNKPMFLLATAPGSRGAKKVLENAVIDMGRKGGDIVAVFSLPSIWDNYNENDGITDQTLKKAFEGQLLRFKKALFNNVSTVQIEN